MIGQTRILVGWGERTRQSVTLFVCVPSQAHWPPAGETDRLALGWYSAGTRLVLGWYSTGTRRTLDWYSAGTRLVLDWYSTDTRLVLDGHSAGTRRTLGWHAAGTRRTLGYATSAATLPQAIWLEAGLPRWKIESPSRSPRHPNSYVSSCKKFLCHCLLVTLGAVDGCERASFERF